MRALAITVLTALAPLTALAAPGPKEVIELSVQVSSADFTTLAMNAAKTTDAIEVRGLSFVTFDMDYTYDSGTAVTMTCAESEAEAGTYRDIQVLTYSGSTATSATHVWSKAVSANASWPWSVVINAYKWLKCTFTVTAGAAADKLTVDARGGVD